MKDDVISRQAAIAAFNTSINELVIGGEENAKTVENYLNRVIETIKCLPSAQPEPIKYNIEDFNKEDWERLKKEWRNVPITVLPAQPKKGKWIHHPELEDDGDCGYECSECHMGSDVDYSFCMRCGADMRGEQDDRHVEN